MATRLVPVPVTFPTPVTALIPDSPMAPIAACWSAGRLANLTLLSSTVGPSHFTPLASALAIALGSHDGFEPVTSSILVARAAFIAAPPLALASAYSSSVRLTPSGLLIP